MCSSDLEGEQVVVEPPTAGLVEERRREVPDGIGHRRLAATELRLTGAPDKPAVVSERPEDL